MAAINTLYDVNDTVYQVTEQYGVRKGTVSAVDVFIRASGIPSGYTVTTQYTIHLADSALAVSRIDESILFDDVDAALAAYKVLVV